MKTATVKTATAKGSKGSKGRTVKLTGRNASRVKTGATITMGILLPLVSLALSNTGGARLLDGHYALAALSFVLMGTALAVSLSHLAWAIQDITRSATWASWALAVAFDAALVLCELCHVVDGGASLVTGALMGAVCMVSMFLNCWAFLNHQD